MPAHEALDRAIAQLNQLRKTLSRSKAKQITSADEIALLKTTALAWIRGQRNTIATVVDSSSLAPVDELYLEVLAGSDGAMRRNRCLDLLKDLRTSLVSLRGSTLMPRSATPKPTAEAPPDFSRLVTDPAMQQVLDRRWRECVACIAGGAPLAATVMMGGLLEALLLARVNAETDKSSVFKASSAPKDKKTGKTQQLQEWTLQHYIDVAYELKWITSSAKSVSVVVRDYRNYVHPYKELSHRVILQAGDATLFWEVVKSLSRQLLS